MGKVTISSEEYKRLLEKEGKKSGKKSSGPSISQQKKLETEIQDLVKKKNEISMNLKKAKQGKGFFKKAGISIGAAGHLAQINKAINEKQQHLRLLKQKETLEVQRGVLKVQKDVIDTKEEVRQLREQERKKLSDDVFGTGDIFKLP